MDPKRRYTEVEYLTLERKAFEKSEFYNGEILPLHRPYIHRKPNSAYNHNRIKENIAIQIGIHLVESLCQSFTSCMRVHFSATSLYAYPDIVIVCGEPELLPDEFDNLTNPTAIIEVLSDGTEAYDRGRKFHRYRAIPTINEYILVDSQVVGIEVHRKNEQGLWTLVEDVTDLSGQFTISTIGLAITLTAVYDRTTGLLANAPT